MSSPIDLPATLDSNTDQGDEKPLFSLAVASYEARRDRIAELLKSVADQPYTNIEVVIADSSKLSYLAETAAKTDWIRHIPCEPQGVSTGFNVALSHANGEIIGIGADDDYVTEDRIVRPVEVIEKGADIVYGDVYDLDDDTGEMSYRRAMDVDNLEDLWVKVFRFDGMKGSIPAASVTFRAECVENERFHEDLYGGEDYHLWVRLFKEFDPVYLPEPLAVMRQHDESLSSNPELMYENRLQAIDLLCDRYPELRPYRQERKLLERYDYARHIMFDGRTSESRSIFFDLLTQEQYYRSAVMLAVSLFPFGHQRIVESLDRLYACLQ